MRKCKRAAALFMAFLMCLLMFPTQAFALDPDLPQVGPVSSPVARDVQYYDPIAKEMKTLDIPAIRLLAADISDLNDTDGGWYCVEGFVENPYRYTVKGNVNLILTDDSVLNARAGITVAEGNSLTIWAQSDDDSVITMGMLTTGDEVPEGAAGIGGESGNSNGAITINGGLITVKGGNSNNGAAGAGIGGGYFKNGVNITINGGYVSATGGDGGNRTGGAGIGGGHQAAGQNIVITGGNVNACGGAGGAGIGGGSWTGANNSQNGSIRIEGGNVNAQGGDSSSPDTTASGIGSGAPDPNNWQVGGTLTVLGGIITATGNANGGSAISVSHAYFDGQNSKGEYVEYTHMTFGNANDVTESEEPVEWTGLSPAGLGSVRYAKIVPMTVNTVSIEPKTTSVDLDKLPEDDYDYYEGDLDKKVNFTGKISATAEGRDYNDLDVENEYKLSGNHADGFEYNYNQSDMTGSTLSIDPKEMSKEITVTLTVGGKSDAATVTINQPMVTVSFDPNNGTDEVKSFEVPRYTVITEDQVPTPTYKDHRFLGWFTDYGNGQWNNEFDLEDRLARYDAEYTAGWKEGEHPVITGVEDGKYYNQTVNGFTVTDVDSMLYSVTVKTPNGEDEVYYYDSFDYEGNFVYPGEFTDEGKYTIIAEDNFGYTDEISFVIDTTAPTIKKTSKLKEGGEYCLTFAGTFVEENMDKITVNGVEMKLGSNNDGFTMTSSSVNKPIYDTPLTIVVTDKAGNTLTVSNVMLYSEHHYKFEREEQPTCSKHGHTYYRCEVCNVATKVVDLGLADHEWLEPTFEWAEDGKSATVHLVCAKDASHTADVPAVMTSEVEVEPDCENMGATRYHAEINTDNVKTRTVYFDEKVVYDIPALGHLLDDGDVLREPTCVATGLVEYHCTRCDDYTEEAEIPATGEHVDKDNDGDCDLCGAHVKSDLEMFICRMCGTYQLMKNIPGVGVIVRIVHYFVHLADYIKHLT